MLESHPEFTGEGNLGRGLGANPFEILLQRVSRPQLGKWQDNMGIEEPKSSSLKRTEASSWRRLLDIRATHSFGNKCRMGNGKFFASWQSLRNRLSISSYPEAWALPTPGGGPTRCDGTTRERWNITEQPTLHLLKDTSTHSVPIDNAKSRGNVRNHHQHWSLHARHTGENTKVSRIFSNMTFSKI